MLSDPHQSCWQWQTGLAGGDLSPTTGEEKRDNFSTRNFKQLSSHLSGMESCFFPGVKTDPWDTFGAAIKDQTRHSCMWAESRSFDISQKTWSFMHYGSALRHLYLKHGYSSNHHKTDCLSNVWEDVQRTLMLSCRLGGLALELVCAQVSHV